MTKQLIHYTVRSPWGTQTSIIKTSKDEGDIRLRYRCRDKRDQRKEKHYVFHQPLFLYNIPQW